MIDNQFPILRCETPPHRAPAYGIEALPKCALTCGGTPSWSQYRRVFSKICFSGWLYSCRFGADSDRQSYFMPGLPRIPLQRAFRWSFPMIMIVFLPVQERISTDPGLATSNCSSLAKNLPQIGHRAVRPAAYRCTRDKFYYLLSSSGSAPIPQLAGGVEFTNFQG